MFNIIFIISIRHFIANINTCTLEFGRSGTCDSSVGLRGPFTSRLYCSSSNCLILYCLFSYHFLYNLTIRWPERSFALSFSIKKIQFNYFTITFCQNMLRYIEIEKKDRNENIKVMLSLLTSPIKNRISIWVPSSVFIQYKK